MPARWTITVARLVAHDTCRARDGWHERRSAAVACKLLKGAAQTWLAGTAVIGQLAAMLATVEHPVAHAIAGVNPERVFVFDGIQWSAFLLLMSLLESQRAAL